MKDMDAYQGRAALGDAEDHGVKALRRTAPPFIVEEVAQTKR